MNETLSEFDKALIEYQKRGGKICFWSCPNGCDGMVNWEHKGDQHIATCGTCGRKNTDTPQKP